MSDRLVKRSNYTLTIEETNLPAVLFQMFESIAVHVDSNEQILADLKHALPELAGLDFVVISYYNSFVSPSNLEGYGLIGLQPFPVIEEFTDQLRQLYKQADDEELCRVLLIATRNDVTSDKQERLKIEADNIVNTRINHLRLL